MTIRAVPLRTVVAMPAGELRGGAELQLLQLVETRAAAGLDLHIVFLEDGELAEQAARLGARVTVAPAGRLRQPHRTARALATVVRTVRREHAELVVGWMAKGHIYGGMAALATGTPAAWLQPQLPSPRSAIDRAARRLPARTVITVSRHVDAVQRTYLPGVPTEVVYPAVDLRRFDGERLGERDALRRRLGLPDGPLIGSVGRLQRWKGFHHLVGVLPEILVRHPEAHLVLVGGDHALEPGYGLELRRLVASRGLEDHVTLAGRQTNPEEWMRASDVFAHTSAAEPFGMVVIEAMAVGTAVVAAGEAGPTEVITDGVDGLLWRPGDEGSLGGAIVRLLDDEAERAAIASAGRHRAEAFGVDQFARSFGAAMWRAAGRDPANPAPPTAAGATPAAFSSSGRATSQ